MLLPSCDDVTFVVCCRSVQMNFEEVLAGEFVCDIIGFSWNVGPPQDPRFWYSVVRSGYSCSFGWSRGEEAHLACKEVPGVFLFVH